MHQNIKINNVKSLDAKLYSAKYYDFMLYKGETAYHSLNDLHNMSFVDFSDLNIVSGILYSTIMWSGATNNGVEMNDIGFTGMDNGLISFKKDRITNEEFVNLLTNSNYKINSGDTRLFLTPITGNTQMYDYPLYLIEDNEEKYIACKGGFYQGFFKLYGHDYNILPTEIEDEWLMHFEIRPRTDYEITDMNINYTHSNNNGIFFFIGTRAENKFWEYYNVDREKMNQYKIIDAQSEGYFSGCDLEGDVYNIKQNNVAYLENEWISDELKEENIEEKVEINEPKDEYLFESENYFSSDYMLNEDVDENLTTGDYFSDGYFEDKQPENIGNKFVVDEYIGSGVTLQENYIDSEGRSFGEIKHKEIISDNKFLLFDRTSEGFTVDTWVEGSQVALVDKQTWPNANYFLLMDRTSTGYTIDTIDNYNEANKRKYDIHNDIRNNVFALRVKEDGSIGYRYGVHNSESENKYEIVEEYSKPGLVKPNEWNTINVRFKVVKTSENCKKQQMKLYFYVNGFLIFISKGLDLFKFRELYQEYSEKQETVPYNISLGGGTLGLLETIMPNYYAISEYILPIEKDFCGAFMGDIKSFKMYGGFLDYSAISNYLS